MLGIEEERKQVAALQKGRPEDWNTKLNKLWPQRVSNMVKEIQGVLWR